MGRAGGGRDPRPRPADADSLKRLQKLSYWLDDRFRIPGTSYRVGLDGLIGIVPGIGDIASTALSSYVIVEALRFDLPKTLIARMLLNLGTDFVIGAIPLIGDVADIGFKANRRNVRLVLNHLENEADRFRVP